MRSPILAGRCACGVLLELISPGDVDEHRECRGEPAAITSELEAKRARDRAAYHADPSRNRRYYREHAKERRAYQRAYYRLHAEEIKAAAKTERLILAKSRKWAA